MKLKQILPLLIITFALMFISIILLSKLDIDNLVNVSTNNNVVLEQVTDLTARDNTTMINNQTNESTNSTTQTTNNSSDSNTYLIVGITLVIFFVVGGICLPQISKIIFNKQNVNFNVQDAENIEMSSAMPTFNN